MDELSKLFAIMEVQETRLLGIAHCIVPKEEEEIEIVEEEPVFVEPPIPINQNMEEEEEKEIEHIQELEAKPEIIQSLIPVDPEILEDLPEEQQLSNDQNTSNIPSDVPTLILSTIAKSTVVAVTEEPVKEVSPITTEIPSPNPDENNIDIVTHTEKPNEVNVLATISAAAELNDNNGNINTSLNYISDLENITVLETTQPTQNQKPSITQTTEISEPLTPSTSPSIAEIILGEMETVSKSPESDNYIYETFSPNSPVNNDAISTSFQRNDDHLVLAEEPPEIPNEAVHAA